MFSKRHYEAIAEILAEHRPHIVGKRLSGVGYPLGDQWTEIRDHFADLFEADNLPNGTWRGFNRAKWEEACER
jgi:hypothetical protein